jgi:hypothetical protein
MICGKERKIILDHLYRKCLNATSVKKDEYKTRQLVQLIYENMLKDEKLHIYYEEINKKIAKYLLETTENSLCFNIGPNCTPDKRHARIREWAFNKAKNMDKMEKVAICEKLNLKLI